MIFVRLGFSADTQPTGFDADLDLSPAESRNFGECGKLVARHREVELYRCK
jgi:hypothetical protein